MQMLKINVLISTLNNGIERVCQVLQNSKPGISYIIIHQYTTENPQEIPKTLQREDVKIIQIQGRGLSLSRNEAIKVADGDIAIIADDDVEYMEDSFDVVKTVFEENEHADIICFKIKTLAGEPEYKEYFTAPTEIKSKFPHHPSSIEIAFRIKRLKEKQINFDHRLGLGCCTVVQSGEEQAFLLDCLKNRLRIFYEPRYIVVHPYESTMKKFSKFHPVRNRLQGALHAKKHGLLAIPKAIVDGIFNFTELQRTDISILQFIKQRIEGAFVILKSNN
jgi:glycosyltransferase involved in cell wall biosynthesis